MLLGIKLLITISSEFPQLHTIVKEHKKYLILFFQRITRRHV